MSMHWTQTLSTFALQHLWHSALLFLLVAGLLARARLSAEVRSWALCAAFALACASPLLVLLPGAPARTDITPTRIEVQATAAPVEATSPTSPAAPQTGPAPASNSTLLLQALAALWLVGTLAALLQLLRGTWLARRLHLNAQPSTALATLLGDALPRGTSVAVTDAINGPMVVGLLRPRILIPTALVKSLPPHALRDLLLHEAAHVRRNDLWISAVQRCLLAIYWWSPFLRLLGRQLDLSREMACDARAALHTGSGRRYADSLLTGVAGLLTERERGAPLAVGMSGGSSLSQRVEGLLALDTRKAAWTTRLAWGAACMAALCTHVGVTLAATPRLGTAPTAVESSPERIRSPKAQPLLEAAAAGDVSTVQHLVRTGVPVDAQVFGDGTALIVAARNGHLDVVEALLALGAQPDQASSGDGNPLIAASRRGHLPVVQRLVAAGADVNRVVPHDETPLINAARSGDVPTVAFLVEHGADVNLGVVADLGQWRSPYNQARNPAVRNYLVQHGATASRR